MNDPDFLPFDLPWIGAIGLCVVLPVLAFTQCAHWSSGMPPVGFIVFAVGLMA